MKPKRTFMTDNFTMSYEYYKTGWTMPYTHYHDSYELYILEEGRRTVTIGDKEYSADRYDVTLFNKNIPHTSRGDTPFAGICIHILESYLDNYFTIKTKRQLLSCFNHTIIHLTEEEFNKIKAFWVGFEIDSGDNFIKLAWIMNILNNAVTRSDRYVPKIRQKPHTKSQSIIQYVNENYVFIRNISDITGMFNVSESYVFKIFNETYNMTPKKYIYKLKLNNVCRRLENCDDTVKDIAFSSGFDCYEYFIRLFKKEMGCTPTEYRNRTKLQLGC